MNHQLERANQDQLKKFILSHKEILSILKELAKINHDCYICAGIIRNSIWSHLHGYHEKITEIDVIYYDSNDVNDKVQHHITHALYKKFPFYEWDVVNQAKVHRWYKTDQNESIEPLCSIWHALSLWPETATAIAIRLTQDHKIEVIAPFGLVDLFDLKLRWNKNLVSENVFNQRIIHKNFIIRWPNLTIEKPFKAGVFLEEKPIYL